MKLNYRSVSGRNEVVRFSRIAPLVATALLGCAAQTANISVATAQVVARAEPKHIVASPINNNSARAHEEGAVIAEQIGDFSRAALLYRRAAFYYRTEGDRNKARVCYQKSSDLNRKAILSLIEIGLKFEKEGKALEAAKAFVEAANIRQAMGNTAYTELIEKTIRVTEAAITDIRFSNIHAGLYMNVAELYGRLENSEKERRMYMKAFAAYIKLALEHRRNLRNSPSKECYEKITLAYKQAATALDRVADNYERANAKYKTEEFRSYALIYHQRAIEIAQQFAEAARLSSL